MKTSAYRGWRQYDYFQWLLEKVNAPIAETHTLLLRDLHNIPFTWTIPMDANRARDGINLRYIYLEEIGMLDDPYEGFDFNEQGIACSVLEMLISLTDRFASEVIGIGYKTTADWFWILMENLDLLRCTDEKYDSLYVRQQVNFFMNRLYDRNGTGGLFPLKESTKDQRKVEIWYQLSDWFNEHYWKGGWF